MHEIEIDGETFVYSKKSGANLVLTSSEAGLQISFGDLKVVVTVTALTSPPGDAASCMTITTNGDVV